MTFSLFLHVFSLELFSHGTLTFYTSLLFYLYFFLHYTQFIMACGKLVKILLHSKVTRYLEFKSVDGSYVFKDGKVQKVPATPTEALNSSLMGFFEKRKFRNFLNFLSVYDKDKPSTYLKGELQNRVLIVFLFWSSEMTRIRFIFSSTYHVLLSVSSDLLHMIRSTVILNIILSFLPRQAFE